MEPFAGSNKNQSWPGMKKELSGSASSPNALRCVAWTSPSGKAPQWFPIAAVTNGHKLGHYPISGVVRNPGSLNCKVLAG